MGWNTIATVREFLPCADTDNLVPMCSLSTTATYLKSSSDARKTFEQQSRRFSDQSFDLQIDIYL